MTSEEIEKSLDPSLKTHSFIADQKSYEFISGNTEEYYISSTVADKIGLTYFMMINHQKNQ